MLSTLISHIVQHSIWPWLLRSPSNKMTPCQLLALIMSSIRQSIVLVLIAKHLVMIICQFFWHNSTKHKNQTTWKHHKFKFIKINIYKLLTPLDVEVLHVEVKLKFNHWWCWLTLDFLLQHFPFLFNQQHVKKFNNLPKINI